MGHFMGQGVAMQDGMEPPSAGTACWAADVIAFKPRRQHPEAERARQAARQAAALHALARRRESFDRYALAGQELLADLRGGCDPAAAVAAFQRKVDQG